MLDRLFHHAPTLVIARLLPPVVMVTTTEVAMTKGRLSRVASALFRSSRGANKVSDEAISRIASLRSQ